MTQFQVLEYLDLKMAEAERISVGDQDQVSFPRSGRSKPPQQEITTTAPAEDRRCEKGSVSSAPGTAWDESALIDCNALRLYPPLSDNTLAAASCGRFNAANEGKLPNEIATMKTLIRLAGLLSIATAALLLNGCALTKDYISLDYTAQTNVTKIAGAEAVAVKVEFADTRSAKDRVGSKKNGYGMEMAAIISNEEVTDLMKKAVETELTQRGFRIAAGDLTLSGQLAKFYNDFKTGFWAGDAVAEITMEVQFRKADGTIVYSKLVSGEGKKENIQLASGANAKVALEGAMRNVIERLFADPVFIDTLLKQSIARTATVSR